MSEGRFEAPRPAAEPERPARRAEVERALSELEGIARRGVEPADRTRFDELLAVVEAGSDSFGEEEREILADRLRALVEEYRGADPVEAAAGPRPDPRFFLPEVLPEPPPREGAAAEPPPPEPAPPRDRWQPPPAPEREAPLPTSGGDSERGGASSPAGAAAEPDEARFDERPEADEPAEDDEPFADAAAGDEEAERSVRELVRQVDGYRAQGYELFGMVGYPSSGKTHALKALVQRLHGFDPTAREHFRRVRAPGPTEQWPFYFAYTGSAGERWVFMDPGGDLYARMRQNDWHTYRDASRGLLHAVRHCRGFLLLIQLKPGHFESQAGFAPDMGADEVRREQDVQKAQEEIEFVDHFLLFARALAAEGGDVAKLIARAADAGLDEALRPHRRSPRLEVPVAVLFTQADRLAEGRDLALGEGRYLAPQGGLAGVAPFVARHLPALFTSLLAHARRFRFDFVQSYVERPSPGGGAPIWSYGDEPLSVGLLPAIEFLQRAAPGGRLARWQIDTRTALRLHRLRRRGLWRGVEVDL